MIKVAYVVSTLERCGPVNQLSYIIKYLDRSIFEPIIITLSPEKEDSLIEKFSDLKVECISLNFSRIEGLVKLKGKLLNTLEEKEIDIVHTQGIRADVLSAKHLRKYKRVCTLRNYPYYDYPMTYGKLIGNCMAFIHLKYLDRIDCPKACSKSVSDKLRNNKLSIKYIQNGVDLQLYNNICYEDKVQLRKKLNIPIDKKVFISVGHLSERKDPLTIIKSFIDLKDYFLIFLGEGNLKEECKKLISDNENINLVGFVPNVAEYLQASDFFISASKAEGLPNTVMEAMSCGLPCVLSNIPPHNEIIEFNEKVGRLFEIEDYKELKNKIIDLTKQSYKETSISARKLIQNNLSAKIMSENYQSEYVRLDNK